MNPCIASRTFDGSTISPAMNRTSLPAIVSALPRLSLSRTTISNPECFFKFRNQVYPDKTGAAGHQDPVRSCGPAHQSDPHAARVGLPSSAKWKAVPAGETCHLTEANFRVCVGFGMNAVFQAEASNNDGEMRRFCCISDFSSILDPIIAARLVRR